MSSSPIRAESSAIRAISLAPHLTELVYAVGAGDVLVGTVEWSDYPAAALEIPRIGDAFRFDIERIVQLQTTHALSWVGGTPQAAVDQLNALSIEVIEVQTRTLDEIAQAMTLIGDELGSAAQAELAVSAFEQQRASFERSGQNQPSVAIFYQVSQRPLFTLGGRHVINEVFALCGAKNVFSELSIEASVVGREAVITAQPQAMIAGQNPTPSKPELDASEHAALDHWLMFDSIPAVACGHLWTVDPALLIRPTPRILDGAAQLCDWLSQIRQTSTGNNPACSISAG